MWDFLFFSVTVTSCWGPLYIARDWVVCFLKMSRMTSYLVSTLLSHPPISALGVHGLKHKYTHNHKYIHTVWLCRRCTHRLWVSCFPNWSMLGGRLTRLCGFGVNLVSTFLSRFSFIIRRSVVRLYVELRWNHHQWAARCDRLGEWFVKFIYFCMSSSCGTNIAAVTGISDSFMMLS